MYDRIRRWLRDGISARGRAALESFACHARVLLIEDQQLDTRGIARPSGRYQVRRDISFEVIRVDAVELDQGEQRVLEALVDWIVASSSDEQSPDPVSDRRLKRLARRDRVGLGG
jgi:hypothetical protein